MRAEILSIGTEILLGHISDTNATYLAQQLAPQGIDLFFISQVGDNQERVTATLQKAWDRADLIITTGGLGPTEDDVTREAIAALLHETPEVDAKQESILREKFGAMKSQMPERNMKQAWKIPSATILPNPVGTAPGWFVENSNHIIVSMPGVPHEMKRMWENEVMPRLTDRSGETLFTRILRITGVGESTVEEKLGDLIHKSNPTVATYAKSDAVDVRISAKATTYDDARRMVDSFDAQVRTRLGRAVFGIDKETLASVIGPMLLKRGWHLGTIESCTGGLLASMITDIPGSSHYMRGSLVTYATDVKVMLGVPQEVIDQQGVISDATAVAMAQLAIKHLGCEVGIGVTGVAGPDPQDGKPVGEVHIAIISPLGQEVRTFQLRGGRPEIKNRAALRALDMLRLHLLG